MRNHMFEARLGRVPVGNCAAGFRREAFVCLCPRTTCDPEAGGAVAPAKPQWPACTIKQPLSMLFMLAVHPSRGAYQLKDHDHVVYRAIACCKLSPARSGTVRYLPGFLEQLCVLYEEAALSQHPTQQSAEIRHGCNAKDKAHIRPAEEHH